jgi:hypothetical protein
MNPWRRLSHPDHCSLAASACQKVMSIARCKTRMSFVSSDSGMASCIWLSMTSAIVALCFREWDLAAILPFHRCDGCCRKAFRESLQAKTAKSTKTNTQPLRCREFRPYRFDRWLPLESPLTLCKIQGIQKATPAPVDQAIDMLRLTSRASELFLQQPGSEQRRLLQTMVEKASWKDGALQTDLFEPFEILRRSNLESLRKENENSGSGCDWQIWLPKRNLLTNFSQKSGSSIFNNPSFETGPRNACAACR